MTRSELIDLMADGQSQLSAKDVELSVKLLIDQMAETLSSGERIEIRGFGVLEVKDTKPKPAARNPRTGEVVYVPARRKTHFKPRRCVHRYGRAPLYVCWCTSMLITTRMLK